MMTSKMIFFRVLGTILGIIVALAILIGSLYLGEWLYGEFGLGGILLFCTVWLASGMTVKVTVKE